MNNIYQCAILSTQIKTINLIIQDLSGSDTEIKKEMRSQIKKLNMSMKTLKCNNTNTKNSIQKSKVLTQTTYQTCKYHSYLEYIRKHNRSLAQLPRIKEEQIFSIHEISEIQKEAFTEIDKEIENIYKIFPIAYQAYSEYENNILTHYMLQIIKKDYHSLRQNLHDTLNPMNQLIYKVSNATKP